MRLVPTSMPRAEVDSLRGIVFLLRGGARSDRRQYFFVIALQNLYVLVNRQSLANCLGANLLLGEYQALPHAAAGGIDKCRIVAKPERVHASGRFEVVVI